MQQGYWLGIMTAAFALTLATWIVLVFRASGHPSNKTQDSTPHREIIGGTFVASEGGRQLMPRPDAPAEELPDHGDGQDEEASAASDHGRASPARHGAARRPSAR